MGFRLWGRTESDTTEATQQQQQHPVIQLFYFQALTPDTLKNNSHKNVDMNDSSNFIGNSQTGNNLDIYQQVNR